MRRTAHATDYGGNGHMVRRHDRRCDRRPDESRRASLHYTTLTRRRFFGNRSRTWCGDHTASKAETTTSGERQSVVRQKRVTKTRRPFVRMGRSITSRPLPMKSSSGRARGVAHIAALFAFALLIVPGTGAYAQKADVVSHGPATRDATPEADASIAQKDWSAALAELNARIAQNPRDAQAKFKRATVLARMDRTDDAIAAFTELTEMYPELPEPYNNLAALYAKQGRYGDARAALETATKANPGYGLAYENLGALYL